MNGRRQEAIELLLDFAQRTGLDAERPPRRYLWTDAFAVCTLLGLGRATGEPRFGELALRLIDQVHHVLGRHRPDDRRHGWLSGLDEQAGAAHPTRGGLRIGKPLPERAADAPFDERLEWERDGQYFHYLTRWMHALDQATRATGQGLFTAWARELAVAAHRAFVAAPTAGRPRRMYWKMSIDLARPQVASMGQHDPLDGLVTCVQLAATAGGEAGELAPAIADFAALVDAQRLATPDPLGIGGLLIDAHRLAQLEAQGAGPLGLIEPLLAAADAGLQHYAQHGELAAPAAQRLAFRELGLAIGLAAVAGNGWPSGERWRRELLRFAPLGAEIIAFWRRAEHRRVDSWLAHADINDVTLATALQPDGLLLLPRPPRRAPC